MKFEISYIGDYSHVLPEGVFLAEGEAGYVKACHALIAQVSKNKSLKIWVRKRYLFAWLQHFCEQIQLPFDCVEKTARLILSETWNVTLPEWLTDEDVVSQKLLDLDVKNEKLCPFAEALLVHLLGPSFRGNQFDRSRIAEIVPALYREEAKSVFDRYPLLSRCLLEQGEIWLSHADQDWEKVLLPVLISRAENLWRDMSLYVLLGAYPPKLLEYVISLQQANILRSIPLALLKDLPLELLAIEEAAIQIALFFKDIVQEVDSSNAFQKVVKVASGLLILEFKLVKSLLKAGRFAPVAQDIATVKEKFRQCTGLETTELTTLDYLVVPPKPALPDKDSLNSPSAWAAWAVDSYLPYRYWQTKNSHYDEDVEEAVRLFTDWYIRDYAAVHQNAEISSIHTLHSFRDSIRSESLSLIILADGLPVTFWPIFEDALRKTGLNRHALAYRFAPLPTDTEFVKPALFSGAWNSPPKSYDALLHERAANDWDGKKVIYLSDLKKLADFSAPTEPTVLYLNLLAGDEILHGDPEAKGETHEGELHRLFMRVSDTVAALLDRCPGQRESFGLYVLTDHGACFILDSEAQAFESKTLNKLFPDERRRFAVIEKGIADAVPANLWDLGYRFIPPFTIGDNVFFIPRGHHTVRAGKRGKGYTHGGATPEEVIVPAAFFKAVKAAWNAPKARFLDLRVDTASGKAVFHIQRITPLRIEMLNPNPEDIRILRMTVVKPIAEIKGQVIPVLIKEKTTTIQLDCYFNKSAISQESLIVQCAYEIAGEERVMKIETAAEFRSALTGGFSLTDL
ncbi:MAG: hypothetical protein FD159_458 [Syntrophaceae bacterium]|nr:MAG: hypothetical protein FD159_458 [Syntrophaceae bacterium]